MKKFAVYSHIKTNKVIVCHTDTEEEANKIAENCRSVVLALRDEISGARKIKFVSAHKSIISVFMDKNDWWGKVDNKNEVLKWKVDQEIKAMKKLLIIANMKFEIEEINVEQEGCKNWLWRIF